MASKSAIVTGGAQGIGKGITQMLLKDGYKVRLFSLLDKNHVCFLKMPITDINE